MSQTKEAHKFWEELCRKESENISFTAFALLPRSHIHLPPHLDDILGLRKDQISSSAKEALDALENMESFSPGGWDQFKWRVWAFLEIQDIFDMTFHNHGENLTFFRAWYFYFESKYILLESLLAALNGLYQSSQTLLRPFLEFSVLQNYYYRTTNKTKSYLDVDKWLKTGQTPKWGKVLKGCLEQSAFADPIRTRINYHYIALSNNFAHPYHQDFSPKIANKSSIPGHSALGLMTVWRMIDLVLEGTLWMYYCNFPMLLQPKDLVSKFGFNGPVGLFIDTSWGHIFKNAIAGKTLDHFQKYSDEHDGVTSLTPWFEEQPNRTLDEIKSTWDEKEEGPFPDDLEIAKIKKVAKLRALREAMSLDSVSSKIDEMDFDPDKVDLTYEGWRKIHSKKKK